MSRGNHTFRTDLLLNIGGVEVEYAATVTYYRHKASGDGWNEPREPAHCELVGITLDFTDTRRIPLDDLIVGEFEDGLNAQMMEHWVADDDDAQERRAEQRRDDALMERLP